MQISFQLVILALIVVWVCSILSRYSRNKAKFAHIPGIEQMFWIQHPFQFLAKGLGIEKQLFKYRRNNLFKELPEIFEKNQSSVVKLSTSGVCAVYVNDLESVKKLGISLRNEVEKPMEMYKFVRLYGPNLISSTGDVWRRHRKVCQFAFTDSNLRLVATTAVRGIKDLFTLWDRQKADGATTVDIPHAMESITLAVISEAAFGQKLDVFDLKEQSQEYDKQDDSVVNDTTGHAMPFQEAMHVVVSDFLMKFFLPKPILGLPVAKFQKVKTGFEEFEKYLRKIVKSRQQKIEQQIKEKQRREEAGEDPPEEKEDKPDCLNLLISSQYLESDNDLKLTDAEIMDEGYIFLFAGHETTASTLCWSFTLLALNPQEQEKVFEEVLEVLGPDRDPTFDDLPKLIYTRAVFNETLRLWPAVPTVPKRTQVEVELGGYRIPPQTNVFTHMYSLHRNPKYWEEPNEFRPSRFDERISPKPVYGTFTPFSIGPRRCLGYRFAEVEGALLLAMLIRKFKFTLPDNTNKESLFETQMGMTVLPLNTLRLHTTPRKLAQ